ncbi:MAG: cyclic nucleotide-binding protein [Acidobacteria bacterium]|nr:MAG: cyclic nucleotide-binding protein [Acidobacteriota bacterium]
MTETHPLVAEIVRLNATERHIIDRFIHRQRVARDITQVPVSLGARLADHVAAFGGSWTFIGLAFAAISVWMLINAVIAKAFDPYPYILLNLVLSCVAALQAPIIMMSQNRQAAHDRLDAQRDYEEIVALHAKLDEIRDQKWVELMKVQEQQLALLANLASHRAS